MTTFKRSFFHGGVGALLLLLTLAPLRAKEIPEGQPDPDYVKGVVEDTSPDGRYALRTQFHKPEGSLDDQKVCDLIEKSSGKVLLRVAESDADELAVNRFSASASWARDSQRLAVSARYNHFGSEITLYVRQGDVFHKVTMPNIRVPDIPERLKHGKDEWKWTGLNDQDVKEWRKDGTLVVHYESTLQEINSNVTLTAERDVVLGFTPKSKRAKILKSTQRTVRHEDEDDE